MKTWAIRIGLLLALIAAVVLAYTHWRNSVHQAGQVEGRAEVQKQWDDETRRRQAVAIEAGENFRKQERRDAQRVMEIEIETRKQEKLAAAAAVRAADAGRGLLGTIASLDAAARTRGLPSAAVCPVWFEREREDAIRARGALGQCTAEYRAVAEVADGLQLRLSDALSYIDVVAPPAGAIP